MGMNRKSNIDGLVMVPCLYCGKPRRSTFAAYLLRLRGCECVACGGTGVVPEIVHQAWVRGECGTKEWSRYWSIQPRWREVLRF